MRNAKKGSKTVAHMEKRKRNDESFSHRSFPVENLGSFYHAVALPREAWKVVILLGS